MCADYSVDGTQQRLLGGDGFPTYDLQMEGLGEFPRRRLVVLQTMLEVRNSCIYTCLKILRLKHIILIVSSIILMADVKVIN